MISSWNAWSKKGWCKLNAAHDNEPQDDQQANRLVHETSPYLRQHAHNPVDWY
ncbi:MAG: DUF255 domain-containing protein, partial [Gemmatimonadota bacterium]|nr:DUF255 domain-containing protein [Gemmatimonadota bacterium]